MAAMTAPKAVVKPGKIFAIVLVLILWIEAGQARSRRNQPNCNEEQQNKMNTEFQECLAKYTKEHHEASGKATSDEDFQKYTCKLLEDTDNCGKVFKRCLPADEVRRMQDTHIQARIQQFRDDKSVYECPVVKEYIESGRGDKVDESTEGACTVSQVSNAQTDFSDCSHKLSLSLYNNVQNLTDIRNERSANDLDSELELEDQEQVNPTLDPIKDIRPMACETLHKIAKDCIKSFGECFTPDDANSVRKSHLTQMFTYYAQIYDGIGDLKECPEIKSFMDEDEEDLEDCMDDDCNEIYDDEDDYYDEDDYDSHDKNDSHNSKSQLKQISNPADSTGISGADSSDHSAAVIPEPPFKIGAGHSSATATANIISQKIIMTQNLIVVLCVFQAWAWLL